MTYFPHGNFIFASLKAAQRRTFPLPASAKFGRDRRQKSLEGELGLETQNMQFIFNPTLDEYLRILFR